jgi:hypothetical protein
VKDRGPGAARAVARPVPGGSALVAAGRQSVPEALPAPGPTRIVAPMEPPAGPPVLPGIGIARAGTIAAPSPGQPEDLIAVAEALGIPWERLLAAEIAAERTLRGFVGEPAQDQPLWRFLSALPATALDSWRVRERLADRVREARLTRSGAAMRCVREAVDDLCGRGSTAARSRDQALAVHLSLALERVRELARAARAAERMRGERAERVARVVERTGCTEADAAWAVERADASGRTHAIDDAVRQARAEGFEIPAAASEFHAFLALRKLARRHPVRRSRRSTPRARPAARRHAHQRLAS